MGREPSGERAGVGKWQGLCGPSRRKLALRGAGRAMHASTSSGGCTTTAASRRSPTCTCARATNYTNTSRCVSGRRLGTSSKSGRGTRLADGITTNTGANRRYVRVPMLWCAITTRDRSVSRARGGSDPVGTGLGGRPEAAGACVVPRVVADAGLLVLVASVCGRRVGVVAITRLGIAMYADVLLGPAATMYALLDPRAVAVLRPELDVGSLVVPCPVLGP